MPIGFQNLYYPYLLLRANYLELKHGREQLRLLTKSRKEIVDQLNV